MKVKEELNCEHCSAEFTIIYDDDEHELIQCPFCSEPLEAYIEEDEDEERE